VVKKIVVFLMLADILLAAVSLFVGKGWLVNTQTAFLTSALVMAASMFSYGQMVKRRIENDEVPEMSDRDVIDKLDDPHDLYRDDNAEEMNDTKNLRKALREEKLRIKANRRSPYEMLKDSRASMSIYRLGAYALLVFGFFYLSSRNILQPLPYLIGLGLPVAAVVAALMSSKEAA